MKRLKPASLLAAFALTACGTMHDAAVTTFRVVDAPHQYVRRQLRVGEDPQQTTTTTTQTEVYSDTAGYPPQQPYQVQPPPPPVQTQRRVVATERRTPPEEEVQPTATPRVTRQETTTSPESAPAPRTTTSSQSSELPYAKPVPGKPGFVFSPFDKNGGYVDVTGYSPGQKVKDPYSGKVFLVP
ncbi:MAG: hypothetical protein ABIR38_02165 [Chthoniobacterales bacterium]